MRRAFAILVLALVLVPAASAAVVFHLRDGSTVTVTTSGKVVQRNRKLGFVAISFCGSYANYRRWSAFLADFQHALRSRDHAGVAADVVFPLAWNHGKTTTIRSSGELARLYASIFRPALVRAVLAPDPRGLVCKNGNQFTLGDGIVWGEAVGGRVGVIAINGP